MALNDFPVKPTCAECGQKLGKIQQLQDEREGHIDHIEQLQVELWSIKEWPFQTHLKAKTKAEHLERIDCLFGAELKKELRAEIKELENDNLNLSDDLGWHKAIFDGSWPQAVEILEWTLAKVKVMKGE